LNKYSNEVDFFVTFQHHYLRHHDHPHLGNASDWSVGSKTLGVSPRWF